MKEFYNTLVKGHNQIYGVVRGITIKIDKKNLGITLHMSTDGSIPIVLVHKETTIRMLIGENIRYINGELLANQLSVEMRLLHSFISHILFLKIGHFDFISNRDLVIMQSIIEQVPINLPRLMMNYM